MTFEEKYKQAYQKIKNSRRVLIVAHERPDGDALSSACAISTLLNDLNKEHSIHCNDTPLPIFNFLPNIEKIKTDSAKDWDNFDLIIIVDCGAKSRTKIEKKINSKKDHQYIIEFDHHPKVDDYANLEIRIPEASSTAEVLTNFFKTNNLHFDKNLATCLLTGILTDTLNFLNPSTTAKTIAIASEMLAFGAQMSKINRFTWKNKNIHSMKILGYILENLKINKKYNFAFFCLTNKDLKTLDGNEETFDSVMNFLSSMNEIKAIMILREETPGNIKGNLRTNYGDIDISQLAKHLHGGGHAKASGFNIKGRIIKTANSWQII